MAKNVVVCCDGTANEFAHTNTNVVKLFSVLKNDADQVCYYHPGIGTMEPTGALTTFSRKWTKLLGMAIGYGLENDIRDAYVFIMRNFVPGDRLFLFGFSRGAYTVRAVCSLLHSYGLIRSGNEPLVPYAIRMMMGIERAHSGDPKIAEYFDLAEKFKATMSLECKPYFVGVWDTVSSVGWVENPLHLPFSASNPDIQFGRHAVAIDERRAFFRTNLWHPSPDHSKSGPRNLKQVWFAGVHCDVGGGYAEQESGLSKLALQWMLAEAEDNELEVNVQKRNTVLGLAASNGQYVNGDPHAAAHESLTWKWWFAEFIPKRHYNWKTGRDGRRMNLFRRRTIPDGADVHESVFERGPEYAKRLPKNFNRVSTIPFKASSAASGILHQIDGFDHTRVPNP